MSATPQVVRKRPAETSGLAGAVVLLGARAFGVTDPDVLIAAGVVVAALPAVVTWIVSTVRRPSSPS